jgi:AcrR family transcriptional regulator
VPRTDRRPRQRLDADTRRGAILAAAATAFGQTPYADVSVSALASEVGASEALVYRYFETKAQLYAAVVHLALDDLLDRQRSADAALPPGTSARDRVRTSTEIYLDRVSAAPTGWSAPYRSPANDPAPAVAVRHTARATYVEMLRAVLRPDHGPRREYALRGYFGFLEAACLRWVEDGCPAADRAPLVDAALGALEGALGDWGR